MRAVGRRRRTGVLAVAALALAPAFACTPDVPDPDSPFRFERHYLDLEYGGNGRPGWVRAGDMDGDGDADVVAGGGEALFVYENTGGARGWVRHGGLDGTGRIGANGAVLVDVDRDGDLDVVSALFRDDLGWWENPGGALASRPWTFHPLHPQPGFFAHDLILADVDGDGRRREIVVALYRQPRVRVEWYRVGPHPRDTWQRTIVEPGRDEGALHYAGLDVGDVDGDGDPDIAFSNGWYEGRGGRADAWTWHEVTGIRGISNTRIRDVDGDGRPDLVLSAGHHGRGVFWFEASAGPEPAWVRHAIAPDLVHPECLQVEDLDRDGDPDVATCELDFERWDEQVHGIYVVENAGEGARWRVHRIAPPSFPSHQLQAADVDGDGWLDLISEGAGFSVVSLYRRAPPRGKPAGPEPTGP